MKPLAVAAGLSLLVIGFAPGAAAQDEFDFEPVGCDVGQERIDEICSYLLGEEVTVSQVVCIDDFQYTPSMIEPNVGDTVAWVNVEECGDMAVEDVIVNQAGVGCDPHHTVTTYQAVGGVTGDTVGSEAICSPHGGVPGSAVPDPPPGACGEEEINVYCHTFASAGTQHYSCLTNVGHTALMHGTIFVE